MAHVNGFGFGKHKVAFSSVPKLRKHGGWLPRKIRHSACDKCEKEALTRMDTSDTSFPFTLILRILSRGRNTCIAARAVGALKTGAKRQNATTPRT